MPHPVYICLPLCLSSLVERRKQWRREEQERQAREADAEIPAGHRLMSDDERLQTLDRIQLSTFTSAKPIPK